MQTGRAGLPTNLALPQSSYAAWPPGSRVSITLPMGFATSWLSGLSNAGEPTVSGPSYLARAQQTRAPRAVLVKLPPPRAELVRLPEWRLGEERQLLMPSGLKVLGRYKGRLFSE